METDIYQWTKLQLQNNLRSLGLPVSGNKDVLIQRIKNANRDKSEYAKMTTQQLNDLLKTRKLQVTRITEELIYRLAEIGDGPKIFTSNLPKELLEESLLNLNYKDLVKACRTNKASRSICNTDSFWELRLERMFGTNIHNYNKKKQSYRELYKDMLKNPKLYLTQAASTGDLLFIQDMLENDDFNIAAHIHTDIAQHAEEHGHMDIVEYIDIK